MTQALANLSGNPGNSYSAKERERICDLAVDGYRKAGTIKAAAESAGVDRYTIRLWMQQDPLLKKRFEDADEDVTDRIEEKGIALAEDGSEKLIIKLLESRRKRYQPKVVVEATADMNIANVVEAMRQIALAQPTLKPILLQTLQRAIERIAE